MNTKLSRREFLRKFAYSTAYLACFSPASALGIINRQIKESWDAFSFIDIDGLGPPIEINSIESMYVALHGERQLPSHTVDKINRGYAEWLLRRLVDELGVPWDEKDEVVWTYQYYGFCDHSGQCFKLLEYCLSAQNFLYDTTPELLEENVQWNILNEDFDFSAPGETYFNGIIGRYNYLVSRVNLVDKEGNAKDHGLIRASPVNRATNFITSSEDVSKSSLIYIIPGNSALVSPFSEMLYLKTHSPSLELEKHLNQNYNRQLAHNISRAVGESITESAAILLAGKYLEKYNNNHRMNIINVHAESLAKQYPLFTETMRYMKRHGVQQTIQAYNDNPMRLMNKISHNGTDLFSRKTDQHPLLLGKTGPWNFMANNC